MRIVAWSLFLPLFLLLSCSNDKNEDEPKADKPAGNAVPDNLSGEHTFASLQLAKGVTKTFEEGAQITVTGADELLGTLVISDGARLTFKDNVKLAGTIKSADNSRGQKAFVVVAEKKFESTSDFVYGAVCPLQVVSDKDDIMDPDDIYALVENDLGADAEPIVFMNAPVAPEASPAAMTASLARAEKPGGGEVQKQVRPSWPVTGSYSPSPNDRSRPFYFLFFPRDFDVHFSSAKFNVPKGADGAHETKAGEAKGSDAKNSPSLLVRVPTGGAKFTSTTLNLGDGGDGGRATSNGTQAECDAEATGGAGGTSGNLKIVSKFPIVIESLTINPGKSGNGGRAEATGCDRPKCVGPGGSATAVGGQGGHNKKKLTARGVQGLNHITIGKIIAGDGGHTIALAGKGSDNETTGSLGGLALTGGGKKGVASFRSSLTATSTEDGKDGLVTSTDGQAGAVTTCSEEVDLGTTKFDPYDGREYVTSGGCNLVGELKHTIVGNKVLLRPFYTTDNSAANPEGALHIVTGYTATATGVEMFGNSDHTVTLTIDDTGVIEVVASSNTGSCTATLTPK